MNIVANVEEPEAGTPPAVGERLRERRRELKMTLQDVADTAGFSVGFISQIERGITVPSLVSLVAVCRALGVDISTFFQQPEGNHPPRQPPRLWPCARRPERRDL